MLLNQTVLIKWNPKNKQYYANKGYIYTKMKDNFLVKIDDLSDSSDVLVDEARPHTRDFSHELGRLYIC